MIRKALVFIILWYLRIAAKIQLLKTKPKIIGIAGSSGKTSLAQLTVGMLCEKYQVHYTQGRNSETGVPLDILDIHMNDVSIFSWLITMLLVPVQLIRNWKKYDYFVVEMGIDSPVEPRNMSYLLKIVEPTIATVTNVTLEHAVYFEPYIKEVNPEEKKKKILDMIAREETMVLTMLDGNEKAVVNLDDPCIAQVLQQIDAQKITISLARDADLVGKDIESSLTKFSMVISYQQKNYFLTIQQGLPKHYAYDFLLAIGIGLLCDMSIEECIAGLQKHFTLPAGRLSIFQGIKNTILIDSTYNNATPQPILDILQFVKDAAGTKRKVAIIGDLRELGEESQDIHEAVAQQIVKTVDFAILIGPLCEQFMVPILRSESFPFENFPDFSSSKEAILDRIQEGDIVLVKGSQNTLFLERVVEMLLANKEDKEKLTRRGKLWDKKREETK